MSSQTRHDAPAPARRRTLSSGQALGVAKVGNNKQGFSELPEVRRDLPPAETDGARVEVELGTNENLGDFNHAKVHVRVSVPCLASDVHAAGLRAYAAAEVLHSELSVKFTAPEGQ